MRLRDRISEDNTVSLLFSYDVEGLGTVNNVQLSYMTGEAEEAYSKPNIRKSMGKMMTELLVHVLVKIDGKEASEANKRAFLRALNVADRDLLLLSHYYVSFGEEITIPVKCRCGAEQTFKENVLNLEVKEPTYLQPTVEVELFHGIRYGEAHHKRAKVARVNGAIQEVITTEEYANNPAKLKSAVLLRIIKELGTLQAIPPHLIESLMSVKDKNIIMTALNEKFDGEVSTQFSNSCVSCGETITAYVPPEKYLMGE